MKRKVFGICLAIALCLTCGFSLVACDNGGGGGGGGGGGEGGGTVTSPNDFTYWGGSAGYTIKSYNGNDKVITLPTKAPNGTPVVGIYYVIYASGDDDSSAPFERGNVEEINIPANITVMKNGSSLVDEDMVQSAFYRAKSLKRINVASDNPAYSSKDGVLYNKNMTTLLACPAQIGNLSIPEGVTKIATAAFMYDYSLGDGNENASNSNFENFGKFSSNFTTVSIPSTLKSFTFEGCRKLTSVDLSRSAVTRLTGFAFRQCLALKILTLKINN